MFKTLLILLYVMIVVLPEEPFPMVYLFPEKPEQFESNLRPDLYTCKYEAHLKFWISVCYPKEYDK